MSYFNNLYFENPATERPCLVQCRYSFCSVILQTVPDQSINHILTILLLYTIIIIIVIIIVIII